MKLTFRDYYNSNKDFFIVILLTFILFLIIEDTVRVNKLFLYAPWVDIPLHFISGLAFFWLFWWIGGFYFPKFRFSTSLFIVLITALLWEVIENIQEMFIPNEPYLIDIFWWDGFLDVFWSLIGGVVAYLIISYFVKKSKNK